MNEARYCVARCKLLVALCTLEEKASIWMRKESRSVSARNNLDNFVQAILEDVKSFNDAPARLQSWLEQAREINNRYKSNDKDGQRSKKHYEDVNLLYNAWGENAALMLTKIQDIHQHYSHPRARLALLSAILKTDVCSQNEGNWDSDQEDQERASSGVKRALGDLGDPQPRKKQCQSTPDIATNSTARDLETDVGHIVAENRGHNSTFIPNGVITVDSTSGTLNTELLSYWPLRYLFQWQILNSSDVLKIYEWGTLHAMTIMLPEDSAEVADRPMYSDEVHDYYALEKAKISQIPDSSLVEAIQRSKQWQEEMKEWKTDNISTTKCLTIALVKGNFTPMCVVYAVTDGH